MTQEEHTKLSRTLILELAIVEFGKNGYKSASVNRICAEGNISKGRMFHHFKNKDDIFLSAARYLYDGMLDYMNEFEAKLDEDPLIIMQNFFRYKQSYFVKYPTHTALAYIVAQAPPEHLKEECAKIAENYSIKSEDVYADVLLKLNPPIPVKHIPLAKKILRIASFYAHYQAFPMSTDLETNKEDLYEKIALEFDEALGLLFYGLYPKKDKDKLREQYKKDHAES